MTPRFNIGDIAWVARAGMVQVSETCPHCFGSKALTVILGDESKVSIECAGCRQGYEPPRGFITVHKFEAVADYIVIESISRSGEELEYNHKPDKDVFATKEEALIRAEGVKLEHEAQERQRLEHVKDYQHRTWSWNATYHRGKIKDAQQQIEYHTAKLNVAKVKAKEEKAAKVAVETPTDL